MKKRLTHVDERGRARMVDVTGKPGSERTAVARGHVTMKPSTLKAVAGRALPKGDVITVAKLAGIMAAKRTADLIPMCHPLNLTSVDVSMELDKRRNRAVIEATVKTVGQTGVEMEALVAVAASALAFYDMCKSIDRDMVVGDVMLIEKRGGKSGTYRRK